MAIKKNHGGACCGAFHLYNFLIHNQKEDLDLVKHHLRDDCKRGPEGHGRMCEIVLTDGQIKSMPVLCKGLKKLGFKLKTRFLNRNSGNYCNVLHWSPTNELNGSPFRKL